MTKDRPFAETFASIRVATPILFEQIADDHPMRGLIDSGAPGNALKTGDGASHFTLSDAFKN